MKALNVQPYHARPPSSAVVVGKMVATASASKAVATTISTRPDVSRPRGGCQMLAAPFIAGPSVIVPGLLPRLRLLSRAGGD